MDTRFAPWLLILIALGSGTALGHPPASPCEDPPPAAEAAEPALPEVVEGGRKGSRRLVLVLHGGSYRPRAPLELAERALEPLEDAARKAGLRLVAPLVPDGWLSWGRRGAGGPSGLHGQDASTVWASPQGEALVLAYLDEQLRKKRVDPDRVFLAGHGAGATAAIHLAARHPERFAALALWSGTPSPEWAWPTEGAEPVEGREGAEGDDATQQTGINEQRSAPRVVGLVGEPVPRLAGVGVYLWTGQDDDILDREALALFVARMRQHEQRGLGHELVWETGPGGHDYGPRGAREGLAFLKRHRRAARK